MKSKKHKRLLSEVSVPDHIKNNVLTDHDIENEVIVVDGGNSNNPPIRPPDGVHWRCISVIESKFIMAIDETDPRRGLSMSPLHGTRPFIRMPRAQALSIQGNGRHMTKIHNAFKACETMKKSHLMRCKGKRRIFGDYGKSVMITCAGV
jgi:hypothetical protein